MKFIGRNVVDGSYVWNNPLLKSPSYTGSTKQLVLGTADCSKVVTTAVEVTGSGNLPYDPYNSCTFRGCAQAIPFLTLTVSGATLAPGPARTLGRLGGIEGLRFCV